MPKRSTSRRAPSWTRSSLSTLSAEPGLTGVIGSTAPPERLEACLSALEPQIQGVEVLVHEAIASPPSIRDRYPWARFTTSEGALVPHLWRDGIDAARGSIHWSQDRLRVPGKSVVPLSLALDSARAGWVGTMDGRILHVAVPDE